MITTSAARKPSMWAVAGVCSFAVLLFIVFRFYVYADRVIPITYALPLLLGVWHKNRNVHATMMLVLSVLAAIEVFFILPPNTGDLSASLRCAMMLINVLTVGIVVDRLIVSQRALRESFLRLESANAELEASNEELAAREEEISGQNEELQQQSEELEQQLEELQQQSEELQHQGEELQHLHDDSQTRERVLQTLLEVSARQWQNAGVRAVADEICAAALAALGPDVSAALILGRDGGRPVVHGSCGMQYDSDGAGEALYDPFLEVVFRESRAAGIEDLRNTPEVAAPPTTDGVAPRAVLAAPLRQGNTVTGVLAVYARPARSWSKTDFEIVEWLAAQAGLVLLSARLQAESDERAQQAEEASRRKTRFLAAVSHDVRTPANAISLMAEVIKQAGDNPELAHEVPQLAEALRSNAKLLVELVSDVLDLSRFDSGRIDVEPTEFNLAEVIQAEIRQHHSLAQAAGLSLTAVLPEQPVWLRTDRMKLARVLGNLLGNAIKFTEVGKVEVICMPPHDGMLEIHVRDTGVGIGHDHLEHIFDEFYQIRNPERNRHKGTGLGLAICKRLIDAIGCALTVQSRVAEGTTFAIRVPADLTCEPPASANDSTETPSAPAPQRLRGLNVLVVEDHETTRQAVVTLLQAQGAQVEQAPDGRTALRLLQHANPDVVLLDLMLPDMDGRDVLRFLAANRASNLRCLLAVSGDVTEARQREVEMLGADGLLPKPMRIEALTARICDQLAQAPDQT